MGSMRIAASHADDSIYIVDDRRPIAAVFADMDNPRMALAHQMAAAPLYYDAVEWIAKRLAETGEDLAEVRDVRISALMLGQLMEAHEAAKGGAS